MYSLLRIVISFCLSTFLSIFLSIFLAIFLIILTLYLSLHLFHYISLYLSVYLSFSLSLFIFLSLYLSLSPDPDQIYCGKNIFKNRTNRAVSLLYTPLFSFFPSCSFSCVSFRSSVSFHLNVSRDFRHLFGLKLYLGPMWISLNSLAKNLVFAKTSAENVCPWPRWHRVRIVVDYTNTVWVKLLNMQAVSDR